MSKEPTQSHESKEPGETISRRDVFKRFKQIKAADLDEELSSYSGVKTSRIYKLCDVQDLAICLKLARSSHADLIMERDARREYKLKECDKKKLNVVLVEKRLYYKRSEVEELNEKIKAGIAKNARTPRMPRNNNVPLEDWADSDEDDHYGRYDGMSHEDAADLFAEDLASLGC